MRIGWLLAIVACGPRDAAPEALGAAQEQAMDEAAAGVTDPALRALLIEHWDWLMAESPVWATMLGDHRFDDRIGDGSLAGVVAWRKARDGFLERARALPVDGLSPADAETLEIFVGDLERGKATDVCRFELWSLSPRDNALEAWSYLPEAHQVVTEADGDHLLVRYQQIPRAIGDDVTRLRTGMDTGRTPNARSVTLVVAQLDAELAKADAEWSLYAPVAAAHPEWDAMKRTAYQTGMTRAFADIKAAYAGYRAFLHDELLPASRGPDAEGLGALPKGADCYAATILAETSLPKTAEELHATGLAELERIHAEMADLGERLLGTRERSEIFARLRSDPELHFHTAEEVEAKATSALDAARAAIPQWFGRLPKADCVVRRVPDYEAPYTTIAYYRQPSPDRSKPGEYFVNVYQPETRPTFEAEVLAFHESIPGHHLQIAIAQELPDMPMFRRHLGTTAFVEGWGLYSERLALEMGLYSGDLDRMGMLSFDAWRASRLVVDTGVHAMGWTREQAERFMLDNTPLAENNVTNEVDRYITTPGQALAYKTGQLTLLALRAEAEAALGDRFDLPAFHDTVLGSGAVPLPVLERHVRAYVATRAP